MINTINNNTTFTSVVPVRVRIDGMEVVDEERYILSACRQLSRILAGPTKEKEITKLAVIRKFAGIDPDYNLLYGISGYPKSWNQTNIQPSDYFRHICDDKKRHFFLTGAQAEKLRELGEQIGSARKDCKTRNISNSFDLMTAYGKYWGAIKYFIKHKEFRLTENFDYASNKKFGNPVTLVIDMISNHKYGLTTFKMKLDSVSFEKAKA